MSVAGKRGGVDHLELPPSQALQVPHEPQRKANARADVEVAASDRSQPLDFAGVEIEEIHDGAWHAEQVAQPREDRLGDLRRRLGGDQRSIDLMEESQPFGGSCQRTCRPTLVSKRKPAEPGERRREHRSRQRLTRE